MTKNLRHDALCPDLRASLQRGCSHHRAAAAAVAACSAPSASAFAAAPAPARSIAQGLARGARGSGARGGGGLSRADCELGGRWRASMTRAGGGRELDLTTLDLTTRVRVRHSQAKRLRPRVDEFM